MLSYTNFIEADMLNLSLISCKFQSSIEGGQGTVDLTLKRRKSVIKMGKYVCMNFKNSNHDTTV